MHYQLEYEDLPLFDISHLNPSEYLERGKDDKPDAASEVYSVLEPFTLQPGDIIRSYRCSFSDWIDSDEEDI
jgi:hypothetical protein